MKSKPNIPPEPIKPKAISKKKKKTDSGKEPTPDKKDPALKPVNLILYVGLDPFFTSKEYRGVVLLP